ncbi:FG-GAP-like repeat-containing protein [Streptomyces sp. NBC_00111]|uniref:FG-GAP-like repeat-containing protein n=1 Tax=unclassified Streptomyces TaxID=2593676 RepID=UPI003867E269
MDADDQLNLYRNSGGDSFSGSVVGGGWGSMVQVAAADFDGDGDGDVVSTSGMAGAMCVSWRRVMSPVTGRRTS